MSKIRDLPGGSPRFLEPTTTTKLASRMLQAQRVASAFLPPGLYSAISLDILLSVYVAEEKASYLSTTGLDPIGGGSTSVIERWVKALAGAGLLEEHGDLLALTEVGHRQMTTMITAIYNAQRALD